MLSTLQHQSHQAHFAEIRRQAAGQPSARRERKTAQATSSGLLSSLWVGSLRAARSS
jgi:hypothetical protein